MGKRNDAFKEVQQSWANILDYRLPITYDLKSPLTPTIDELRQRGWGKPGSELGLPIPVPLWYLTGKSFDQRVPLWYLTGKPFDQRVPLWYLTGKPFDQPVPLWYLIGKSFDQRVFVWYLTGRPFEQAVPILYLTGESFDRTGPPFEADQEVLSKLYDQSTLER